MTKQDYYKGLAFFEEITGGLVAGFVVGFILLFFEINSSVYSLLLTGFMVLFVYTLFRFNLKFNLLDNNHFNVKNHLKKYHFSILNNLIGAILVSIIFIFRNRPFGQLVILLAVIIFIILFYILLNFVILKPAKKK